MATREKIPLVARVVHVGRDEMTRRIFLLSPASCSGERARVLLREAAAFPLAVRLRQEGAPLGEVFSFLSGLYFRGKLAYARRFSAGSPELASTFVITPTRGLLSPDASVTAEDLREFASVPIDHRSERYRVPLERDVRELARRLPAAGEAVLLGSIATAKYVDVLSAALGSRLVFPADFAGRGDMSRGGLLLRSAREGRELGYVAIDAGARHGPRPPKLAPLPRPTARRAPSGASRQEP